MAENLSVKIEAILDGIELQLKEIYMKVANIEETVSRLDSQVQVLKTRTTKLEKNVEELGEGFQYNEDNVRDLQRDNKKLKYEVHDLKKQLLYMEITYSRRESLKSFGVPCQRMPNAPGKRDQRNSESCLRTPEKLCTNSWRRNLRLNNPARKLNSREFTA